MSEPIPKVNDPGLLDRIAKNAMSRRKVRPVPAERMKRWARWWEWRTMGLTIRKIYEREKERGNHYTDSQIVYGLNLFVHHCGDSATRGVRIEQRRATAEMVKRMAFSRLAKLQKEDEENGGKGMKVIEQTVTANGRSVRKKVSYVRIDSEVRAYLDLALKADRYIATLEGLLSMVEQPDVPTEIAIDLGSFFEDAPTTPIDVPFEIMSEGGAGGG